MGDNDWPGVRVIETNGATTVAESPSQFGVSESDYPVTDQYTLTLTQAPTAGVVTVTVTGQPTRTSQTGGIVAFSKQVIVCILGPSTCTSYGDFSSQQLVTFDGSNWDLPQTVVVRAIGNDRVDGMDTHVFAPTLDQLNNIQGPLFVNGGEGADRTGLLEREPLMLPKERNLKPAMGAIITSTEGAGATPATVTIDVSTITGANQTQVTTIVDNTSSSAMQQLVTINATGGHFKLSYHGQETGNLLYNASALQVQTALEALPDLAGILITVSKNSNQFTVTFHDFGANTIDQLVATGVDLLPVVPTDLTNLSIEITSGPAKNKIRIIKSATQVSPGVWQATLDHLWLSPFDNDASTPTSASTYTLYVTNPNLLVDERASTDILWVYDDDNPASFDDAAYVAAHHADNPFAVGSLSYETSSAYDHDRHGRRPAARSVPHPGLRDGRRPDDRRGHRRRRARARRDHVQGRRGPAARRSAPATTSSSCTRRRPGRRCPRHRRGQ